MKTLSTMQIVDHDEINLDKHIVNCLQDNNNNNNNNN